MFKSHALRYIILATQTPKFPYMNSYNPARSAAHDGVVFQSAYGHDGENWLRDFNPLATFTSIMATACADAVLSGVSAW